MGSNEYECGVINWTDSVREEAVACLWMILPQVRTDKKVMVKWPLNMTPLKYIPIKRGNVKDPNDRYLNAKFTNNQIEPFYTL